MLCCLLRNHLKWWFSFYEAIESLCAATDNISGLSLEKSSHHIKPEAQWPPEEMGQCREGRDNSQVHGKHTFWRETEYIFKLGKSRSSLIERVFCKEK